MEHSPSVELSRQEAMMLIRIANEGDLGAVLTALNAQLGILYKMFQGRAGHAEA
jgi:hypothetical protein